jgi:MFS transporter, MHS family, alpha-ketoglutarate permease
VSTKNRIKSIFGGSLGNLIEWYDWYIYSAFSLYFAASFFPQGNLTAQLLNTAAIFAVGFLMRPIGGLLMGIYADKKGRKAALIFSVVLMCFGSLLIALAPTYEMVGMFSPAILIFARLIQGISVGGEYGVSATYLSEMATSRYRGFYSSFQYVTLIMGQLIALSVLIILQRYLLTPEQLYRWGWRIPFLIGGLGAYVGFYLRCRIKETDSFENESSAKLKQNPLIGLIKHPKEVLIVIGLTMGGTLAFYTYSTYMQKFMVNTVGLSRDTATLLSASTLVIFMIVQPLFGLLSDVIGRRRLLITFGILGSLTTVPILTALSSTQNTWLIFALITTALLIVSTYTSISAIVKAELFPVEIRSLGVSLPYAIAVSIFGGTAEYLALWSKSIGHESWFFWYVSCCIMLSLVVYIMMPDTKENSCLDDD